MDAFDYKKETGQRFKVLRKKHLYTQESFAEKMGVSLDHYSRAERGITGLSVKKYCGSALFSVSVWIIC